MSEIWKTAIVDGVENPRYQVSNLGRVKCLDWRYTGKEKICKLSVNGRGYLQVQIDGKNKRVHRIVAETFIPNPEGKPFIDHINTVRTDNFVLFDENKESIIDTNLRWVTLKENNNNPLTKKHISENSKMLGKFGAEHPYSIPIVQLTKDGVFVKKWSCASEAERELGISKHISSCCKGRCNSAGGFRWVYATDYVTVKRSISEIRPLF